MRRDILNAALPAPRIRRRARNVWQLKHSKGWQLNEIQNIPCHQSHTQRMLVFQCIMHPSTSTVHNSQPRTLHTTVLLPSNPCQRTDPRRITPVLQRDNENTCAQQQNSNCAGCNERVYWRSWIIAAAKVFALFLRHMPAVAARVVVGAALLDFR